MDLNHYKFSSCEACFVGSTEVVENIHHPCAVQDSAILFWNEDVCQLADPCHRIVHGGRCWLQTCCVRHQVHFAEVGRDWIEHGGKESLPSFQSLNSLIWNLLEDFRNIYHWVVEILHVSAIPVVDDIVFAGLSCSYDLHAVDQGPGVEIHKISWLVTFCQHIGSAILFSKGIEVWTADTVCLLGYHTHVNAVFQGDGCGIGTYLSVSCTFDDHIHAAIGHEGVVADDKVVAASALLHFIPV